MCLIVYQPHGSPVLAKDIFRNGWDNNSDGAGYMFAAAGKVVIRKPFYSMRKLWKAYQADHAEYGLASPFVVHFRWATHGNDEAVNIHPHPLCGGKVALVHNGILDIEPPLKSGISDTVFFCRTILAHRQPSFVMGKRCNSWLAELIGPQNKFVMMDGRGNVSIVNSESGVWDGGLWFSNSGYKPSQRKAKMSGSLFKTPSDEIDRDMRQYDIAIELLWESGRDLKTCTPAEWGAAFDDAGDILAGDFDDVTLSQDELDDRCFQDACKAAEAESDPAGWGRLPVAAR